MEDPREAAGANDAYPGNLITPVETIQAPDGTAYGFSLLDEESRVPCFRLAFETREDAEQGRTMMKQIIEHCLFFEVPDGPEENEPSPAWGSRWR